MSIFLLGANGTLGIQLALIAKKKKNYTVTCLVRRFTPEMDYLSYYGVRILYGNILNSKVLLESIFGSNVVIDATTGRNFEKIEESDLKTKLSIIKIVKNLKIDHFIFFSFVNAEKFSTIPLVKAKLFIEEKIKEAKINYTIFRLTGFFQGVIKEYMIPLLEKKTIFLTEESIPISYIDSADTARLVLKSFTSKKFLNQTVDIGGLESWEPKFILNMCEQYTGLTPIVKKIPIFEILAAQFFTSLYENTWPISRRLALIEITLKGKNYLVTDSEKLCNLFEIEKNELRILPRYIKFYVDRIFNNILRKIDNNGMSDEKELTELKRMGIPIKEDLTYLNEKFEE